MASSLARYLPRTIRGQLVAGTILLQLLLLTVFLALIVQRQTAILRIEDQERVASQVVLLAQVSQHSMEANQPDALPDLVRAMRASASIQFAKVTDLDGMTMAHSDTILTGTYLHDKAEIAALDPPYRLRLLMRADGTYEAVAPITLDGHVVALAWVTPDSGFLRRQIWPSVQTAVLYAFFALLINTLLAVIIARTVSKPLRTLINGMRQVVRNPEAQNIFPLRVTTLNEVGELTIGFNTMVRELDEQRADLNDTLALLDSMLANAPIGFQFFDREFRFVRLNQFMADMHGLPIAQHLGHKLTDLLPVPVMEEAVHIMEQVFATGEAVREMDLTGYLPDNPALERSWLSSFYPVQTTHGPVRWVGMVVVETTQRRAAEESLRRTEKLAATGRLAASIAHEINNPLEAVTNLIYLLRFHPSLNAEAQEFAEMAQRELLRVSQITQQTLRFYRQSTQPVRANVAELLDSVLLLHQGRIHGSEVEVVRRYQGSPELFSFGGELRQLFANLVGNGLDAMNQSAGNRLIISMRKSRCWRTGAAGVRISIADTGTGITEAARGHIFEAFYTTKEATGTGLGLWVSIGIVQKHHGTITFRSRVPSHPGGASGTVFMLFFPHDGVTSA